MMQLGFHSAIMPEASLDEVLATAARLGYQCVEIMCWPPGKAERRYAGVTHIDVTSIDAAEIKRIGELTDRHGVSISAVSYYPNMLSGDTPSDKAAAEHFTKVIQVAADLGIGRANSFVGRNQHKTVKDNWQPMLDCWGPLVDLAEKVDVKIGIENCPMWFSDDEWPGGKNLAISPAIWRRMFADLPSKAWGLNYDPSHMIYQQMDEVAPIHEFADRIYHAHAKDLRVDKAKLNDVGILANPGEYHTPKLPGLGEVNWRAFFAALTDINYGGPICVEVEDRPYEATAATREQSLIQSHTYLRQFVPAPAGGTA